MRSPNALHLLATALAGWLNRHQQAIIDYLIEENRIFKQQLDGRRLRLSDDDRRRLAAKGKALGRQVLAEVANLVTPDTIPAWHRKLIAQKWTYSQKAPGRPRVSHEITELLLRVAGENPTWGYDRLQGALANLGHTVAPSTVANILKRHGIEPAPERGTRTSWRAFLKAHWDVMAATDFFTIEVWTPRGLVTYYVLFVIHLATRKVSIVGATPNPNGAFMMQIARNLTDELTASSGTTAISSWIGTRSLPRPSETPSSERVSSLCGVRHGRRLVMPTRSALSAR